MKKRYSLIVALLVTSLSGCYAPQNYDNQVQISRTGQYQVDVDTDVVGGYFLAFKNESKVKNKPIPEQDLKKLLAGCEKEFNDVVARDAKNGKHIISSKYLGECKGHLTLKYTGNIIQEKEFNATIGSAQGDGFYIPVDFKYDVKSKQIIINSKTKADRYALEMYGNHAYNGKLSIKTDGKVISTNSDSKPYWGLIGTYKWNTKDMTTPDAQMVISTATGG